MDIKSWSNYMLQSHGSLGLRGMSAFTKCHHHFSTSPREPIAYHLNSSKSNWDSRLKYRRSLMQKVAETIETLILFSSAFHFVIQAINFLIIGSKCTLIVIYADCQPATKDLQTINCAKSALRCHTQDVFRSSNTFSLSLSRLSFYQEEYR